MRIHNVFAGQIQANEHTVQAYSPTPAIRLPPRRDRIIPLESPKISLWEFLKMRDCALNSLIAKRNSPLGKVMPPSQYLIYTQAFIPLANDCMQHSEISPTLKKSLSEALTFYRQHRRAMIQNAVFHAELEQLFHPRQGWSRERQFPSTGIPEFNLWIQALSLSTPLQLDQGKNWTTDVETSLQRLARNALAGHWIDEITKATHQLSLVNQRMLNTKPLCLSDRLSEQGKIMQTVFQKHFAGNLQPWISELHRFGEAFKIQFAKLVDGHPAMTRFNYSLFIDPNGPWIHFQNQWHDHVSQWQYHLKQCGLMPAQSKS